LDGLIANRLSAFKCAFAVSAGFFGLFACLPSLASDRSDTEAVDPAAATDPLRVDLLPYVWFRNTDGAVRSGPLTVDLTGSFFDYYRISDDAGFGFAKIEVRRKRFDVDL